MGIGLRGAGGLALCLALPAAGRAQSAIQEPVGQTPTGAMANVCRIATSRSSFGLVRRSYHGSAVLYRNRYLITAAHNVFSPFYRRLTSLGVACGALEPDATSYLTVDPRQVRVACGYRWFPKKRYSRDFAIVRLPAAIAATRPLTLRPFALGEVLAGQVRLAGFPTRENGRDGFTGRRLFSISGNARLISGPFVEYDIDTHTGNSGGPVWVEEPDGPRLVGVHAKGLEVREGGQRISRGHARLVDRRFVAEIEAMIASFDRGVSHCGRGAAARVPAGGSTMEKRRGP